MKHIINKIETEREKLDMNTATCSQHELTAIQYLLIAEWLIKKYKSFSVNCNNDIAIITISF
jgi:hypothetical protein